MTGASRAPAVATCTFTPVEREWNSCSTPGTSGKGLIARRLWLLRGRAARRSLVLALVIAAPAQARTQAPGAPGTAPTWPAADKHGLGTSATRASKVWLTLRQTSLTEVYYPDLSHPSTRDLRFQVDGRDESHATGTVEQTGLTYVQ